MRGFLAQYTIEDITSFMRFDVLFPCHKFVKEDTEMAVVDSLVRKGDLPLCRGYVEMLIKSSKLPRAPALSDVVVTLKNNNDISEDSMSIFEFISHHIITP